MITDFDKETAPLNELEQKALIIIADTFNGKPRGRDNAVSGDEVARGMMRTFDCFALRDKNGWRKPYLSGPRVRKIINRIRVEGKVKCLLANNKGYYVSDDVCEVRDFLRSLKEREKAIHQVYDAIKKQAHEMFPNEPAVLMEIE